MILDIIGISVSLVIIILFDLTSILSQKPKQRRKTILVASFFLLSGFSIGVLIILDRPPISPAVIIGKILTFLLGI